MFPRVTNTPEIIIEIVIFEFEQKEKPPNAVNVWIDSIQIDRRIENKTTTYLATVIQVRIETHCTVTSGL
jgi:hypothetical protein